MTDTLFEQPEPKEKDKAPHYHGHRDRLRQKFIQSDGASLADYEVLELLLFSAIPRKDVKPLAKLLLSHFGTLHNVFNADHKDLEEIDGISTNTATLIKTIQAIHHRMLKENVMNKPVLTSWSRLIEYCEAAMAHETKEQLRILFLNKKNELIADEVQQTGTVDHTPAYPREIIKRALELSATAIIIVHNHPSGDPTPSEADIDMTYAIMAAGEALQIAVHDHLIVSRKGTTSLKTLGHIS